MSLSLLPTAIQLDNKRKTKARNELTFTLRTLLCFKSNTFISCKHNTHALHRKLYTTHRSTSLTLHPLWGFVCLRQGLMLWPLWGFVCGLLI